MRLRWVVALLTAALGFAAAPTDFRLPDGVVPRDYHLDLRIDPTQPAFEGTVRVAVELRAAATEIWLNALDLDVAEAAVEVGGSRRAARAELSGEFLGLLLDEPVAAGSATIVIRYRGQLHEKPPVGAYRVHVGGEWFVFTTFTAIDARRAFPCFDEPRFKTTWTLTIHTRRNDRAFANTAPASTSSEPGGWKVTRFTRSLPLPTELVAFAVGPFDRLDGGSVGEQNTHLSVITPPHRRREGGEAVRAARVVLPRLESYTGIPYAFGKLDFVALPESAFGAVENPGLITYREKSLLLPRGKAAPLQRLQALRGLEAHELAHQWFGNLVTQKDWDDVWLSEGFATWLGRRTVDEDEPPARRRLAMVVARERIMQTDATGKALPVRRTLTSRDQMANVYNPFVYQKGASILWMLEAWLGESRFQQGLRSYLAGHRFGNASTPDLASALQAAANTDPTPVLHSFLDHTGVPRVRIETKCSNGRAPRLLVEQTAPKQTWSIPLCWKTAAATRSCAVVDNQRQEVALAGESGCPAWIYPNAGGSGYYRIEWTEEQLTALNNGGLASLTAAERLTLVYDLRAMVRADRLPAAGAPLLKRLASDKEPEIAAGARSAVTGGAAPP